jgi:hypothetical protein
MQRNNIQSYKDCSKKVNYSCAPSYIESVCVLEKKSMNLKPTRKSQRQAQFRSKKISKRKRAD